MRANPTFYLCAKRRADPDKERYPDGSHDPSGRKPGERIREVGPPGDGPQAPLDALSRMGGYDADHEIPIIAKAEGPYVWDDHGNRYLDGLAALFCCNAGHGRPEYAEAAAAQIKELDFYTNWSYAHPRAIELAERIAELTPGDLNRVFFTNSGSEAVEAAIKVARNFHRANGKGQKHKIIAREVPGKCFFFFFFFFFFFSGGSCAQP